MQPRTTSAAVSLALPRSDYPKGAQLAVYPATNEEVDYLLSSAHRTSFQKLHREDGVGWVQAALWHFTTGKGGARTTHRTTFAYAINIFGSGKGAHRAQADAKIPRRNYRVAHLSGLLYESSGAAESLTFLFFVYRNIEVETYYEYAGVAPKTLARSLRHIFNRQASHLVHLARVYSAQMQTPAPVPPTPTRTARPTSTSIPLPTDTPAPTATMQLTPTSTVTPTASPTPSPTPTNTSVVAARHVVATASTTSPSYPPYSQATLVVHVLADGEPLPNARIAANFMFPGTTQGCSGFTDATGTASCSVQVPEEPSGAEVQVVVQVAGPHGESATTSTTFNVRSAS